jgi:SAM-dependent methyltransferase
MVNHCNLCKSLDVQFALSFPDANQKLIDFYQCGQCGALSPYFESNNSIDAVGQQVRYHEDWWSDSSDVELDLNLKIMTDVVSQFQSLLGMPKNGEGAVIELGCGRGTMLRALADAGYSVMGCEPSAKLVSIARTNYGISQDMLLEMAADAFLDGPVKKLSLPPRAVILWHVLEHLKDPLTLLFKIRDILPCGGHLILQLPLLHQPYIYPEHYFFVYESSLHYLARRCGFSDVSLDYDRDNLFLTASMKKSADNFYAGSYFEPLSNKFNAISEAILVRDQSIAEKQSLINERWSAMQRMESMIRERDEAIRAQTNLIDEKVASMATMESMIRERDEHLRVKKSQLETLEKMAATFDSFKKKKIIRVLQAFRIL